jgi:carbonic anhydrase
MKAEQIFIETNPITDQWKIYFDSTQKLIDLNDTTNIYLNLSLLMLNNLNDFWRYSGSLTIPPCTQNVIWTIFKQPISIFNYGFESFRDDLFFESYRGPQNLYSRKIYRSFHHEDSSDIPDQQCCPNKQIKLKLNFFSFFLCFIYMLYF